MKLLIDPPILYSRSKILLKPSLVPAKRGIYAWYFKEFPAIIPREGCIVKNNLTLLYIGITPSNNNSTRNLRKRIINSHFRGNAKGSTLRLSLGVLLKDESNYPLRRVGNGERMTFTKPGEEWLNNWMEENAFVCWMQHPEPWEIEERVIMCISPPLNIKGNNNSFSTTLSDLRRDAKRIARETPISN
ncbi:MAG: hypothetical protein OXG88_02120 [Gammaproteobacteria bacterium]|nr:hypothetical protein [Gammaproteobacteria bacterium]